MCSVIIFADGNSFDRSICVILVAEETMNIVKRIRLCGVIKSAQNTTSVCNQTENINMSTYSSVIVVLVTLMDFQSGLLLECQVN